MRHVLAVAPAVLAAASSVDLPAQAPARWASTTLPNPLLRPSGTGGALMMYRQGSFMQVFSVHTRRWHSHTPSAGTTPRISDEIVLVPESDRFTALAARRGVFELVRADFATSVVGMWNKLATVQDGGSVHVFSAYTGRWHTTQVPAAWTEWPLASRDRELTVFADPVPQDGFAGGVLFDSHTGRFHPLAAQPRSVAHDFRVSRTSAMAYFRFDDGREEVRTFSSPRGATWGRHTVVTTAPNFGSTGESGLVSYENVVYSGITGNVVADPVHDVLMVGMIGTARTAGGRLRAICAGGGAWTPLPAGASPVPTFVSPRLQQVVAFYPHAGQVTAFSGVNGKTATVSMILNSTFAYKPQAKGVLGLVVEEGTFDRRIFNGLTGTWTPILSRASLAPSSALCTLNGQFAAYAARTDRFVPLVRSGSTTTFEPFGVAQATRLDLFDPITARWIAHPGDARAMDAEESLDGQTLLLVETRRAIGFDRRSREPAEVALPADRVSFDALDGGGYVTTTGPEVLAFGGMPDLSPWAGLPEDSAALAPGTVFRHQLVFPTGGGVAAIAISPPVAQPTAVPGVGTLWLDLARTAVLATVATAPGEIRTVTATPIPDLPVLRGTEWFLQGVVVPNAGRPYPTDLLLLRLL